MALVAGKLCGDWLMSQKTFSVLFVVVKDWSFALPSAAGKDALDLLIVFGLPFLAVVRFSWSACGFVLRRGVVEGKACRVVLMSQTLGMCVLAAICIGAAQARLCASR